MSAQRDERRSLGFFVRGARVVLRKEVRDHLRDRRSLMSAMSMPLLGPLLVVLMFTVMSKMFHDDRPLMIPIRGAEHAPNLVAFLERTGAQWKPATGDLEAQVRMGKLDFALDISEEYPKQFNAGRAAELVLVVDDSRTKTAVQIRRLQSLLRGYSGQIGALRLMARGVSPELASALKLEEINVSTPEKTAAALLSMVPMFLLMCVFTGGMYLAIDSMAGERERGSLEPLLINPVTCAQVILGKWGAVVMASCVSLSTVLAGFMLALPHVPLQDLGARAQLGLHEALGVALVLVPLAFFASALQMLMALFARTYKEAQTYLSLLMMIPSITAAMLSISPPEGKLWMILVPVLGQTLLLNDVLRGEPLRLAWIAAAAGMALLATALAAAATTRMLGQEKIVFGRGAGS